ncbi:MAG: acyl-CoA thioesterase [Oscillospiraceae bacterium]|jgi:acyl-CoA hydrolase|nr:acyl-CoA thioesterase [Oscillospiraceae bacterium]
MLTQHVQIILPQHVNASNRLFGGQLMAWIDIVAAVEARRHAHTEVTTAAVDNLQFIHPAYLNDTIRLDAQVTWTGRTSMEVRVDTYVESLSGEERQVNCAFIVFVALDASGKPTTFPAFIPQTEEERKEWSRAEERRAIRMKGFE